MFDVPHIGFIVAAYALAGFAIAAMVAITLIDYRSLSAKLAALEDKRGARRDGQS